MSCAVSHRRGSDLALLWLWYRLAAVAPIRPPVWELLYAAAVPLKSKKKERKFRVVGGLSGKERERKNYRNRERQNDSVKSNVFKNQEKVKNLTKLKIGKCKETYLISSIKWE